MANGVPPFGKRRGKYTKGGPLAAPPFPIDQLRVSTSPRVFGYSGGMVPWGTDSVKLV